jgi:hypothetical protein
MTYNITKSNGDFLIAIQPGDIDEQTTSLRLLGQGVVNYGELVAENFVQITESFAGPNLPRAPMVGQLWFDSVVGELKVIDENDPVPNARVLVSTSGPRYVTSSSITTEPVTTEGDLRYFSVEQELRVSNGTDWKRINEVYEGSDINRIDFPIGTILSAQGTFNRNQSVSVIYNGSDTEGYTALLSVAPGPNVLLGFWHARGTVGSGYVLVQRTG